jgi:hypothetical protein
MPASARRARPPRARGLEGQRRQLEGNAVMHDLVLDGVVVEERVSVSIPVLERSAGGPLFARLAEATLRCGTIAEAIGTLERRDTPSPLGE